MIGVFLAKRAIAAGYNAMNRHDLEAFVAPWLDDGVFIYPGDVPASGTYEGKSAIEGWFRRFFEQFPEIRFEIRETCVQNTFDLVGNNVAAVHWDVQLTNRDGRKGSNSGVSVITIRGGKIARVKDFMFDAGDEFRSNWGAA
jgi:ketosteroid isomerase-like protein